VVFATTIKGSRIMHKVKWMGQFITGLLLSTAGFADDANTSKTDVEQAPAGTVTLESLIAESAFAPRWQRYQPVEATTYASGWRQPIASVDFLDNSALGRVSKLRNLSLLTLAESGRTRLFLGVNDDGMAGLHFVAIPKNDDDRYLSLVRMPYLKKDKTDLR
jgi:hypothetical protein